MMRRKSLLILVSPAIEVPCNFSSGLPVAKGIPGL